MIDNEVFQDFINSKICNKNETIVYTGKKNYTWEECDEVEIWYRVVTLDKDGNVYIYLKLGLNNMWVRKVGII